MTWIQLMNRWRSNVWVCVELLLAFCLAWYMVDYFFVEIYNRSLPSGRDYANVWQVEMGLLPETSPDYRAAESDSIAMLENYERIKDRLRDYPGGEGDGRGLGLLLHALYGLLLRYRFGERGRYEQAGSGHEV